MELLWPLNSGINCQGGLSQIFAYLSAAVYDNNPEFFIDLDANGGVANPKKSYNIWANEAITGSVQEIPAVSFCNKPTWTEGKGVLSDYDAPLFAAQTQQIPGSKTPGFDWKQYKYNRIYCSPTKRDWEYYTGGSGHSAVRPAIDSVLYCVHRKPCDPRTAEPEPKEYEGTGNECPGCGGTITYEPPRHHPLQLALNGIAEPLCKKKFILAGSTLTSDPELQGSEGLTPEDHEAIKQAFAAAFGTPGQPVPEYLKQDFPVTYPSKSGLPTVQPSQVVEWECDPPSKLGPEYEDPNFRKCPSGFYCGANGKCKAKVWCPTFSYEKYPEQSGVECGWLLNKSFTLCTEEEYQAYLAFINQNTLGTASFEPELQATNHYLRENYLAQNKYYNDWFALGEDLNHILNEGAPYYAPGGALSYVKWGYKDLDAMCGDRYVVYAGTDDLHDFENDQDGLHTTALKGSIYVHRGFAEESNKFMTETTAFVRNVKPYWTAKNVQKASTVFIAGHSLGGAIARIVAHTIQEGSGNSLNNAATQEWYWTHHFGTNDQSSLKTIGYTPLATIPAPAIRTFAYGVPPPIDPSAHDPNKANAGVHQIHHTDFMTSTHILNGAETSDPITQFTDRYYNPGGKAIALVGPNVYAWHNNVPYPPGVLYWNLERLATSQNSINFPTLSTNAFSAITYLDQNFSPATKDSWNSWNYNTISCDYSGANGLHGIQDTWKGYYKVPCNGDLYQPNVTLTKHSRNHSVYYYNWMINSKICEQNKGRLMCQLFGATN